MKFKILDWKIKNLVELYENGQLELNPPYQRNDIWSLPAKKKLIDSIKLNYPLPTFFIYERKPDLFEMVDGQQRTRTILGYIKKLFPDLSKKEYNEVEDSFFMNEYSIPVILISASDDDHIEDFYYRVNNLGVKLNRPETLRAKHFDTPAQNLVERIADSDKFQNLELFTASTQARLTDLDFIAELLTLVEYGVTDKKIHVDMKYYGNEEFTEEQAIVLEQKFNSLLDIISNLNKQYPIKKTRYKQRNDFYTLLSLIREHPNLIEKDWEYLYNTLVLIGPSISPSNNECYALQDYAFNCITQSNSKDARNKRFSILKNILLNITSDVTLEQKDLIKFFKIDVNPIIRLKEYYTINHASLKQ